MPHISVIIPTYKRPAELSRALNSVVIQTFPDIEILVVNDDLSSENEVKAVIKKFNDQRIKYYNNDRKKGANGARNVGMLNATGNYITFLDDDDEFMQARLKELADLTMQTNADAVLSNYYLVSDNEDLRNKRLRHEINLRNFLDGKVALGFGSNLFIRRNIIEHVGLWNEHLERHQDLEFMIRFLSKIKVEYLNKRLLRVHGHNGIPDPFSLEKSKAEFFDAIKPYIQNINKKTTNRYYASHYIGLALSFGENGFIRKMIYYGLLSLRLKILSPKKYLRCALCLVKKYIHIDAGHYWIKLKVKISAILK